MYPPLFNKLSQSALADAFFFVSFFQMQLGNQSPEGVLRVM